MAKKVSDEVLQHKLNCPEWSLPIINNKELISSNIFFKLSSGKKDLKKGSGRIKIKYQETKGQKRHC